VSVGVVGSGGGTVGCSVGGLQRRCRRHDVDRQGEARRVCTLVTPDVVGSGGGTVDGSVGGLQRNQAWMLTMLASPWSSMLARHSCRPVRDDLKFCASG
jgi:hypothetical protein